MKQELRYFITILSCLRGNRHIEHGPPFFLDQDQTASIYWSWRGIFKVVLSDPLTKMKIFNYDSLGLAFTSPLRTFCLLLSPNAKGYASSSSPSSTASFLSLSSSFLLPLLLPLSSFLLCLSSSFPSFSLSHQYIPMYHVVLTGTYRSWVSTKQVVHTNSSVNQYADHPYLKQCGPVI